MKNILKKTGKFKASVLAATLIMLGIVLATSLSVSLVSVKERQSSISSSKSNVAYQAADSGIEIFMQKKKNAANVNQMADGVKVICNTTDGRLEDTTTGFEVFMYGKDGNKIGCNDTDGGGDYIKTSKVSSIKVIGSEASQKTSRSIKASVCDQKAFGGVDASMPDFNDDLMIQDLLAHNGKLYASTADLGNIANAPNARIYRYDGNSWTKVFQDATSQNAFKMVVSDDGKKLYAALGSDAKIIEISDSNSNGDFDSSDASNVLAGSSLGGGRGFADVVFFNNKLYAGFVSSVATIRRLWYYDGVNLVPDSDSPFSSGAYGVALGVFQGNLYLGENGNIWRCDGVSPCQNVKAPDFINVSGTDRRLGVSSLMEFNISGTPSLLATTSSNTDGLGRLYYSSTGSNGSWTYFNNFGSNVDHRTVGSAVDPIGRLFTMGTYKGNLYVGAGPYRHPDDSYATIDTQWRGRLYMYDGTQWKLTTVKGFENNYRPLSLQEYAGKFYVGTEKNASTNIFFKNPICD